MRKLLLAILLLTAFSACQKGIKQPALTVNGYRGNFELDMGSQRYFTYEQSTDGTINATFDSITHKEFYVTVTSETFSLRFYFTLFNDLPKSKYSPATLDPSKDMYVYVYDTTAHRYTVTETKYSTAKLSLSTADGSTFVYCTFNGVVLSDDNVYTVINGTFLVTYPYPL